MKDKNEEQVSGIFKLYRLLAIAIADNKPQKEQIRLLSLGGLQPAEIAILTGTSQNSVNVTLSKLRKAKALSLRTERRGAGHD